MTGTTPEEDRVTADRPETMKAAYIDRLGPAEAIRFGPLPVPRVGPTDVLVAVDAVTVDPVDIFVRSGGYRTPTPFPFIIGRDLAGTVVAAGSGRVGSGVTGYGHAGFAAGDRVWCNSLGHGGRQGSFAQYAVVPADRLYRLPDGVDPVQAVGVAHMAATAWLGLFRHGRLRLGQTVYIGGAAGNVGYAAVRLAVAAGARVIASAAERDLDRVRRAGAAAVVDYRDPAMAGQLQRAAPDGVHLHWDTSGPHDLDAAVDLAARGGRILLTAAGPRTHVPLPVSAAYTHDVTLTGFAISNASAADLATAAEVINQRLADGTLTAQIADTMPLSRAAEAHRMLENGDVRGRLILKP